MKLKYFLFLLTAIGFFSSTLSAAEIIFVSPIKSDLLLLHFRQGEKNTSECTDFYLNSCDDIWYSGMMNLESARNTSSYNLSSTDDENYSTAAEPLSISIKSKREAGYFSYWIYLELPEKMQEGGSYTISWPGLGGNTQSESFIFNTKNLRSESVHVNQIGYVPNANLKYAYVYQWMGTAGGTDFSSLEGNNFYIVRHSDSSVVYSSTDYGKSLQMRSDIELENSGASDKGWNGTAIWECDLSDLCNTILIDPGEYRLAVDGIGCSFPFRIDADIYTDMAYLVTRGLYHQRSGPARTEEYTKYVKPVDHTPGVNGFKVTYTTQMYESDDRVNFEQLPAKATEWVWPGNPHPHMNDEADGWGWGGYFDAADCDRRRSHMPVSAGLMFIYEMNPGKYADGSLDIPESGNGLADLLDEAKWGIDFFRRLKGPTGGICAGLETTGYYHPSWEDLNMWYAFAEDAVTSWFYAGLAAHLAYCMELNGADQANIDGWIQEAKDAYAWAENESPGNEGKEFIEQKYYASASLFRACGERKYMDDFLQCRSWYNDLDLLNGSYIFVLTPGDRWDNLTADELSLKNSLIANIASRANTDGLDQAKERALRFIKRYNVSIGWGAYYPKILLQILHHHLSGDESVLDYLFTTADLYLGINSDQQVTIGGAEDFDADRTMRDMLNIESNYDNVPGWIPGIVPYKHAATIYNASFFLEPSDPYDWPIMEQAIDARYFIPAGEYTIHETISPMANLFSYLQAKSIGKQYSVIIESPVADSVFDPGSGITIQVSAGSLDGIADKVEFYVGTELVGEDAVAPYELTTANLPEGIYSLSAIAYFGEDSKKSKPVQVVLDNENPTRPLNIETTAVERRSVDIAWDASADNVGVKEYEVYVDDSLWMTSGFNYCSVNGLSAGTDYSIYVKAVDYAGLYSENSDTVKTLTEPPLLVPGRIEAESYDEVVGEVQTDDALDTDGTLYVGWFDKNESLSYSISVDNTDEYLLSLRVARGTDPGIFAVMYGTEAIDTIYLGNTGGWVEWVEVNTILTMEAGEGIFTIKNLGNAFNINWTEFSIAVMPSGISIDDCPADSMETGTKQTLTATVSPENTSIKNVIWSSSDKTVGTVSETGEVSAQSPGTMQIIAKTEYGDVSASCEIVVYRDNTSTDLVKDAGFVMYPNPSQGEMVTLSGKIVNNARVRLCDLKGMILHEEINRNVDDNYSLDISNLGSGVYFVSVITEKEIITRKLLVK